MQIELVTLVVHEYDPAIRFFVDVLGFDLVEDSPSTTNDGRPKRWVVVRPPGAATGLLLARADEHQVRAIGDQVAGRVGFFLRVDDFATAYDRMVAAGVVFVTEPRSEPYGWLAVFLDVAGNRWDLLGPTENTRGLVQGFLCMHDGCVSEGRTVRQVTDARVLAALAHPLRHRLMDVLKVHGPSTASAMAERTGQLVGNVSHHIRALADVGLVEEAPELAKDRRERWWRLVTPSLRWSSEDFTGDPAQEAVVYAAQSLSLDRHGHHVRAWLGAEDEDRKAWRGHAFTNERWMHLTPAELGELSRQVVALLDSWSEREVPDDGDRREPVLVFAYGVPAQP